MDTSFTWKYSTAAAPALYPTQEEKALKVAVLIPWRSMRPSTQFAAAPG